MFAFLHFFNIRAKSDSTLSPALHTCILHFFDVALARLAFVLEAFRALREGDDPVVRADNDTASNFHVRYTLSASPDTFPVPEPEPEPEAETAEAETAETAENTEEATEASA